MRPVAMAMGEMNMDGINMILFIVYSACLHTLPINTESD